MSPSEAINITPARLVAQWTGASHKFLVNVHNFEVLAGKVTAEVFQESFDKHRMNTAGSPAWAPWQGKYRGKGTLMQESGALKKSIKLKSIKNHKITVHTDPATFRQLPKRHRGFCYAAVHNNLNSLVNRPIKGPLVQRQFMGHSTVLERELKELSFHLFKGFPK